MNTDHCTLNTRNTSHYILNTPKYCKRPNEQCEMHTKTNKLTLNNIKNNNKIPRCTLHTEYLAQHTSHWRSKNALHSNTKHIRSHRLVLCTCNVKLLKGLSKYSLVAVLRMLSFQSSSLPSFCVAFHMITWNMFCFTHHTKNYILLKKRKRN